MTEGSSATIATWIEEDSAAIGEGLGRWIGREGYRTLLLRAVAEAREEHPAIGGLKCLQDGELRVGEAMKEHGTAAVTGGVERVIGLLIQSLGQVIGEDMAVRLVAHARTGTKTANATQAKRGVANG